MRGSRRLVGKNSGPLYLPFPSFPLSTLLSLSPPILSLRLAALRFSPPTLELAVLLLPQSIFFSVSLSYSASSFPLPFRYFPFLLPVSRVNVRFIRLKSREERGRGRVIARYRFLLASRDIRYSWNRGTGRIAGPIMEEGNDSFFFFFSSRRLVVENAMFRLLRRSVLIVLKINEYERKGRL